MISLAVTMPWSKLQKLFGVGLFKFVYMVLLYQLTTMVQMLKPACIALALPLMVISVFELTYLVHKNRSVNFCGIHFDVRFFVYFKMYVGCFQFSLCLMSLLIGASPQ